MKVAVRECSIKLNLLTRPNRFINLLPPKTAVYFSVALKHFAASKAIYLGFTFQKDNPDSDYSNDYGTERKLYLSAADLPK